ncbi:MAG: hypothetical protein HRU70_02430 [Phycisphaeraceae bacterium]|nr:MAG: hypothetical protein HRU70_02430 [Phycisphaeraceae bacterium]
MNIPNATPFRAALAIALFGSAAVSRADLIANFDSLSEGQSFDVLTTGGIRFHDVITYGGGSTNFTIEDASSGFLGAGLSNPNVLGFGGYVPGPDMQFGGIKSFQFTSDTVATTAGLDVWTFQGEPGLNTLTLRGYAAGLVIQTVSFSFDFTPTPTHRRLDLPTGVYDRFELFSSGPAQGGDSTIVVDNVTVAAVPAPATMAVFTLGLGVLARRRRVARLHD